MKTLSLRAIFGISLLSFMAMFGVLGAIVDAPNLLRLEYSHQETIGEVTRFVPHSHGLIEVRYDVVGIEYRRTFKQGPLVGRVHEGMRVPVYYLAADPSVSSASNPGELLAEEIPALVLGSLLFSLFSLAVAWSLRHYASPGV